MLSCFSQVKLFATPWTVAHQAPLSTGFPRQGYWSGLSSPGALPNPGIEPASPVCCTAGGLFTTVLDVEANNESDLLWDFRDLRLHPCNGASHLEISSFFQSCSMFSRENDGQVIRGHWQTFESLPRGLSLKQQAVTAVLHLVSCEWLYIVRRTEGTGNLKMLLLKLRNKTKFSAQILKENGELPRKQFLCRCAAEPRAGGVHSYVAIDLW